MPKLLNIEKQIFKINDSKSFDDITHEVFRFQYENNPIYHQYVNNLGISISKLSSIDEIPFLPIEFFKTHKISSTNRPPTKIFTSSGTTGTVNSQHLVVDLKLYEESFINAFSIFYGNPEDYVFLALLPSYLEKGGSSLVYMAEELIKQSKHSESGFYLADYKGLNETLEKLKLQNKKTVLLGVSYALLDMAENFNLDFPALIVMETGGMKGRRKEMLRQELHQILCEGFGVKTIHSEYGMTELLSQSYSIGDGVFKSPPWMRIKIRDVNDPFSYVKSGKTGGINIIDLANLYSCSFIETKDLGKSHSDSSFQILGRFDNSDIRGCNLMVE